MYDGIVNSYIRGEIDKKTCLEMMWIMGASPTERYFYMEEADKQRANNASTGRKPHEAQKDSDQGLGR